MAETLDVRQALVTGGIVVVGDLEANQSITLSSGKYHSSKNIVIADNFGEDVVWATGEGGLTTYSHAYIKSSQDIWVQLLATTTGPVTKYIQVFIPANVLAFLPGQFGHSTADDVFDGAVLVEDTDWDQVEEIQLMRDAADAVGDASVELHLFA